MCRNIRVLHHFRPPTTDEEMRAAALQFVRKVSGIQKPARGEEAIFERAIRRIHKETRTLLHALPEKGEPRTREGEREKGRKRWEKRASRLSSVPQ